MFEFTRHARFTTADKEWGCIMYCFLKNTNENYFFETC